MIRDDFRNDVGELCRAARELLTVFDRQQAEAEAARERAEASRAVFDRYMESFRTGSEPASREDRSQTLLRALRTAGGMDDAQASFRDLADLSRRWETGFCDLYEALIRLNAYPEVRTAVAQVAAQVRTIRLMQLTRDEDVDLTLLPEPPVSFGRLPEVGDQHGLEMFRRERAESAQRFMSGMDDYVREVGNEMMSRLQLTRGHLEELLTAAEALGQ